MIQMASGDLFFAREAHYQALTQISFTRDEAFVFTGGEDAVLHVWRMMDLVDFDRPSDEAMPVKTWNDHTLAITGISCGIGTALTTRLYTSSLDHTVKVRDSTLSTNVDMGHHKLIFNDNNPLPQSRDFNGH
jgi:pre-rRNA-processing protein IPI3